MQLTKYNDDYILCFCTKGSPFNCDWEFGFQL